MPCWKAWVKRTSGLIKMKKEKQVLQMESGRITLIKVETVSRDQTSAINLNCFSECRIIFLPLKQQR
jgi:hypothetical protein